MELHHPLRDSNYPVYFFVKPYCIKRALRLRRRSEGDSKHLTFHLEIC